MTRREHHVGHDRLPGQGAGLARDPAVADAGHGQQDGLDFGRHEFLAADVDELADAAEDTERAVGADLDAVAGPEPTIRGEALVAGVQVTGDLGAAAQPKFVVRDLPGQSGIVEAQERRAGVGALGTEDTGLARTERLDEADARERRTEPAEQAFGHRLGAIGDDAQRGELRGGDAGRQQEVKKSRGRGQDGDLVSGDRRGDGAGGEVGGHHDERAGGQGPEQRVQPADVIETEEREHRQTAGPTLLVGREQIREILHHRLRSAAGAAGEQDQSRGAAFRQRLDQRVFLGLGDARQQPGFAALDGDDPARPDLGEPRRVLGEVACQRDDHVPFLGEREQPGGGRRSMPADDRETGGTRET